MTMLTYHFTTAPDSYDYGCTATLLAALPDVDRWRLIAIDHNPDAGSFHETQIPRYQSGLYVTVQADSHDAAERGLPSVEALGINLSLLNAHHGVSKAAREALACQAACNLSAVVTAMERACKALWMLASLQGGGTDWVNQHPICVLFATQVLHLTTRQTVDHDKYNAAYDVCSGLAQQNLGDIVSRLRKGTIS